ncbi:hypothetical protein L204_101124 [Cryptococcus depauperatus]|nr:hypothetical protein L204_00945 [Cryptococcus depauperatus CBS 7855]
MIPTPIISHLTEKDYENVYEPAEDSFILLDALEADVEELRSLKPSICLEIGSGSGIVSAFLTNLLGNGNSYNISTDINLYACSTTSRTGTANQLILDPVACDLVLPFLPRLAKKIDVLIFNPPYVPTDSHELQSTQGKRDIGGAWAGGLDGMDVTNRVLSLLPQLLSFNGCMYLVAIQENNILEISSMMLSLGLQTKEILRRRAGREHLLVLRIAKPRQESAA